MTDEDADMVALERMHVAYDALHSFAKVLDDLPLPGSAVRGSVHAALKAIGDARSAMKVMTETNLKFPPGSTPGQILHYFRESFGGQQGRCERPKVNGDQCGNKVLTFGPARTCGLHATEEERAEHYGKQAIYQSIASPDW